MKLKKNIQDELAPIVLFLAAVLMNESDKESKILKKNFQQTDDFFKKTNWKQGMKIYNQDKAPTLARSILNREYLFSKNVDETDRPKDLFYFYSEAHDWFKTNMFDNSLSADERCFDATIKDDCQTKEYIREEIKKEIEKRTVRNDNTPPASNTSSSATTSADSKTTQTTNATTALTLVVNTQPKGKGKRPSNPTLQQKKKKRKTADDDELTDDQPPSEDDDDDTTTDPQRSLSLLVSASSGGGSTNSGNGQVSTTSANDNSNTSSDEEEDDFDTSSLDSETEEMVVNFCRSLATHMKEHDKLPSDYDTEQINKNTIIEKKTGIKLRRKTSAKNKRCEYLDGKCIGHIIHTMSKKRKRKSDGKTALKNSYGMSGSVRSKENWQAIADNFGFPTKKVQINDNRIIEAVYATKDADLGFKQA